VINQNYTPEELKDARADCRGETGTTPNQSEAKGAPTEASTSAASASVPTQPLPIATTAGADPTPTPAPTSAAPASTQAQLEISSTPDGADIEIDGNFVGNTPSTVGVSAGQHDISVKKPGFKPWQRKINVSTGQVNVNAALEQDSSNHP